MKHIRQRRRHSAAGRLSVLLLLTGVLSGCFLDDDSESSTTASSGSSSVGGSGVKGPLAGAAVSAYAFDGSAADFLGELLDDGETGANAAITGVDIPASHASAVILEIDGTSATDLTTGAAPVIKTLRTIISADAVAAGAAVYPSPLTTLAFELAAANADKNTGGYAGNSDGSVSEAEFLAAFAVAARQVVSTLGFGMSTSLDINTTPPLLTDDVDSTQERSNVVAYRAAIEAVTAIVDSIREAVGSGGSNDDVLAALARDLSDGDINGQEGDEAIGELAGGDVVGKVNANPANLVIPGTVTDEKPAGVTVGEIASVLSEETAATGTSSDTEELDNETVTAQPEAGNTVPDSDGDGFNDSGEGADNCPLDANEGQEDLDEDGIGDVCDPDRDGDEVNDVDDNCPVDANAGQDNFDGDAFGDACDADRDGDGVDNEQDEFPDDNSEQIDTDKDGVGNNEDTDDDGDGTPDGEDAFPLDETEQSDFDGDGVGDNADTDDDNDGVPDTEDDLPFDDSSSSDTDGDGVSDETDNCVNDINPGQADTDGDGIGDACDDGDEPEQAVWDQFNWDEANWQ